MPTKRLTEKTVAALKAPTASGKQEIVWDDDLKGFGLLLSGVSSARSFIVQRTLAGGKTRRVTIGPCNVLTAAAARTRAQAVLAELLSGRDPKARGAVSTLQQALEAYLRKNNNLSTASRKFYRKIVERHLADWLSLPLREITPDMVQDRHQKIAATVAAGGHGKGHAMANSVMSTLGILINFVAESTPGLVNPVRSLRRQWFDVPRRTRMVKFDDLPKFYKAVRELPNPIHRDLLMLMLFTGLRNSEAAGLRWEEIDFKAGTIRIPAARMKAKREHLLPMSDVVRDLLVTRRAIGRAELVFLTANLKPAFRQIAEKTGIVVSAHDLRRTFITVAESCDISPMALKALVAHATGGDVTTGYVQMSTERLREAAQRVADRMKVLCEIAPVVGENVQALK